MSRSVARALVALLGVLVLGGCASSGSESAAPSAPSSSPVKTLTMLPAPEKTLSGELTAELQQSSRDVALGRFQVWITNGLQEEIRPRRIVYRDALLTQPVEGERLRAIPSGSYRGYPLELIEPTCGGEEAGATVTVFYGGESVEIPVDDETQVVGRWSKERCAERAIERVAALEWSPGMRIEGSGADAVALFRLTAHPTGRDGVLHDRHRHGHPAVHVGRRRLLDRRRAGHRDGTGHDDRAAGPARPLRHPRLRLGDRRDDVLRQRDDRRRAGAGPDRDEPRGHRRGVLLRRRGVRLLMGGFPWTARTRRLIFVVVMLVVLTFPLVATLVTRARIERSGVDVTATVVADHEERGRLPGRVPAAGGDRPRPGQLLRRGRPGDVREGRREQGDRGAGAGGPPGGPPGRGRDPQQGAVRHGGRRRRPRAGGGPVVGPRRPPPPDRR